MKRFYSKQSSNGKDCSFGHWYYVLNNIFTYTYMRFWSIKFQRYLLYEVACKIYHSCNYHNNFRLFVKKHLSTLPYKISEQSEIKTSYLASILHSPHPFNQHQGQWPCELSFLHVVATRGTSFKNTSCSYSVHFHELFFCIIKGSLLLMSAMVLAVMVWYINRPYLYK